jgi:hypothetical protein
MYCRRERKENVHVTKEYRYRKDEEKERRF